MYSPLGWASSWRFSRFCFGLRSACKRKYFRLRWRGLLLVVDQVCDQFVEAMRNSDPRVRIVFIHRFDSNFHSMFTLHVTASAQKWKDNFPPPLLLSVPRDNGLVARKTGCPLSPNFIIINSATRSHFPPGLSFSVEYHFVSDPGPRNDQRPAGNLFANIAKSVELAIHSVDNSSLELFWFAHFVHDELQCSESWDNIHSNSARFSPSRFRPQGFEDAGNLHVK